jgi:hypothetical protein
MSKKKRTKVIALSTTEPTAQKTQPRQLSIEECKAILCANGKRYTDEQVVLIRKVLYTLAEIDYNYHCKLFSSQRSQAQIIPFNPTTSTSENPNDNNELREQKSHSLLPRIYGRTG